MRFNNKRFLHSGDVGRTRTITKFLFLPLTIGSETRWLEKATYEEIVTLLTEYKIYKWYPKRFIDSKHPFNETIKLGE